jgi:hypothetical protein
MTPAKTIGQPVLVYTRIAQNRRKTVLLAAFLVIALVPLVIGTSYLVSSGITSQVRPSSKSARERIDWEEGYYRSLRAYIPSEARQEFDTDARSRIRKERAD